MRPIRLSWANSPSRRPAKKSSIETHHRANWNVGKADDGIRYSVLRRNIAREEILQTPHSNFICWNINTITIKTIINTIAVYSLYDAPKTRRETSHGTKQNMFAAMWKKQVAHAWTNKWNSCARIDLCHALTASRSVEHKDGAYRRKRTRPNNTQQTAADCA